jgi:hypothetical protein
MKEEIRKKKYERRNTKYERRNTKEEIRKKKYERRNTKEERRNTKEERRNTKEERRKKKYEIRKKKYEIRKKKYERRNTKEEIRKKKYEIRKKKEERRKKKEERIKNDRTGIARDGDPSLQISRPSRRSEGTFGNSLEGHSSFTGGHSDYAQLRNFPAVTHHLNVTKSISYVLSRLRFHEMNGSDRSSSFGRDLKHELRMKYKQIYNFDAMNSSGTRTDHARSVRAILAILFLNKISRLFRLFICTSTSFVRTSIPSKSSTLINCNSRLSPSLFRTS